MAGIELPWNVILSQWTGFHKLGRNGFSWHSIQPTLLPCDGAEKFSFFIKSLIGLSSSQLNLGGSTSK